MENRHPHRHGVNVDLCSHSRVWIFWHESLHGEAPNFFYPIYLQMSSMLLWISVSVLESAFFFFWGINPYIVNPFSFAIVTKKIWTCVCLMQCVTLQILDVFFFVGWFFLVLAWMWSGFWSPYHFSRKSHNRFEKTISAIICCCVKIPQLDCKNPLVAWLQLSLSENLPCI